MTTPHPTLPAGPPGSLPAPSAAQRWRRLRRDVRRRVLARRRLLAALCCGVAAAAGVHAVAAPPPPTVAVTTAARDLPAGTVLGLDDLATRDLPPDAVPDGAAGEGRAVGETLAAPLRAGEPVTDVRLVGSSLADAHPDLAALPVRLPDAGQAALLGPGDRIDLVATDPQAGGSRVVAADAVVLAVPPTGDASGAGTAGALVVLAVTPPAVPTVSEAAATSFLSYAFSH